MADMLPQEIAEQLKPNEYTDLCSYVAQHYKQKFGVIRILNKDGEKIIIVELEDNTRHRVRLG